jgi:hypothetical protein
LTDSFDTAPPVEITLNRDEAEAALEALSLLVGDCRTSSADLQFRNRIRAFGKLRWAIREADGW